MALTNADRAEIIAKFARAENDTGSPEVQVAFTKRSINNYEVTLTDAYWDWNIILPTWSEVNGQDDIQWYTATKGAIISMNKALAKEIQSNKPQYFPLEHPLTYQYQLHRVQVWDFFKILQKRNGKIFLM